MLTVYLSSTLDDLREYRARIKQALGGLYLVKESYDADSGSVRDSCLEDVDACDIYVGVFAFRYGWRPKKDNPEDLSITELEYRRAGAGEAPKPRLLFLLDRKNQPWLEAYDDRIQDPAGDGARIGALLREIAANEAPRPALFTTPEDLAGRVLRALQLEADRLRKRQEEARLASLRPQLPSMHPEARRPHPRQLEHAMLLCHVAGSDEGAALLLERVLPPAQRPRRLAVAPEDLPSPAALDRELASCRSAAVLLTAAGLARLEQQAEEFGRLLDQVRARRVPLIAITVEVAPGELPARWQFDRRFDLGAWLPSASQTVTFQVAGFLADIRAACPDFDQPDLIGLNYSVLAMNAEEAQQLTGQADVIRRKFGDACHEYFQQVLAKLEAEHIAWQGRYRAERLDWQPFGDKSIAELLRGVVRDINEQAFVSRRDQENLGGNRIRLRYYPIGALLDDDEDVSRMYRQMRRRGCLLIADELSLLEPRLRRVASAFLDERSVAVVTLAPLDPTPLPLERTAAEDGPINLGNLLSRFRDSLDPQCEVAVASRARLRRWLRQSVPETLGGFEGAAPDPERAAEFRRSVLEDGRSP